MPSYRGLGTGRSGAALVFSILLLVTAIWSQPVAAEVDLLDQVVPDATIPAVPSLILYPRSATVRRGKSLELQAYLCKTISPRLEGESVEPDTLAAFRFPEGVDGIPGTPDDLCAEIDVDKWEVQRPKVAKLKSGPQGTAKATGKKAGVTLITAERATGSAPGDVLDGVMVLTVVDKLKNYFTGSRNSLGDSEELRLGPGSQFTLTNEACEAGKKRKCLNLEFNEVGLDTGTLIDVLAQNRGTAAFEVDPERAAGTAMLVEVLRLLSDLDRPVIVSAQIGPEELSEPGVPYKIGDFNGDGRVDALDARYVFWDFGPYGPGEGELDLNADGLVDIWDFYFIQQLIESDGNDPFDADDMAEGANAAEREDMSLEEGTDEGTADQFEELEELPGLESDEPFVLEGAFGGQITFPPELRDAAIDYGFHLQVEDELTRIAAEAGAAEPGMNESARMDAAEQLRGQLDDASATELVRLAATFAAINEPVDHPEIGPSPPGGFYHPDLDADSDGDVDFEDVAQIASSMDPMPDQAQLDRFVADTERFEDLYYSNPESTESDDDLEAVDEDFELTDEDLELPGLEPDDEKEE